MARRPERYMQNARIQFVSLVDKAANRREFLTRKDARGQDEQTVRVPVFKRDDISEDGVRYITGVAYEPGVVDTQGDQMTAEEIAKAAHRYMRDYRGVDIQHSMQPEDGCWIAESTVHKSATTIAGQPVPEGAWTVTVGIENPEVIAKVDSGELNGLSIGGFAQYVLKADQPPQDGPEGEQGMFRKLFAWLGESLGLLKPADGVAPPAPKASPAPGPEPDTAGAGAAEPPKPEPPKPEAPPQPKQEPEDSPKAEPSGTTPDANKQEVHERMTGAEFNEIVGALREALTAKGMVQEDSQQAPTPKTAPFQKSDTDTLAQVLSEAVAKGIREAATPPKDTVAKSDGDAAKTPEPAAIVDSETLMACIKSAVQDEIAPMRTTVEAIAKSHNMPTNAKDTPSGAVAKRHYMEGVISE